MLGNVAQVVRRGALGYRVAQMDGLQRCDGHVVFVGRHGMRTARKQVVVCGRPMQVGWLVVRGAIVHV
jgi:hypothetical protein